MASPFATFRKYDKVLLVVFGVLIIFAFVVGDSLQSILGGGSGSRQGGGSASNAAVTFAGGSLSSQDLGLMHRADMMGERLIARIAEATRKKEIQPREFPEVPMQFMQEPKSEARLVRNFLLARKAHQMGLTLSDEDIKALLLQISNDALKPSDIDKEIKLIVEEERGLQPPLTERALFAQLRVNFLAQETMALARNTTQSPMREVMMMQMGMPMSDSNGTALTPAQAWELFRRTQRNVKIEMLPLNVADFIDQVKGNPTAAQKDEYFQKYKDNIPNPYSADPGFTSPHQIAFGYVTINFQPFLDKAKSEITEEQLREEYKKRVDGGDFIVSGLAEKEEESTKEESPDDKNPEENKPDDVKSESKPEEPKAEEPPKTEEPKSEEAAPEEESENEELEDESSNEEELEPEAEAAEEASPAEDPEANPEDPKPESDPAADPEVKEPAEKPAEKPEPAKPQKRVRTFEEVEGDLRNQLAQKPAAEAHSAARNEVIEAISSFGSQYRAWEADRDAAEAAKVKKAVPDPPVLNLNSVLKKYDFKEAETTLLTQFELAKHSVFENANFYGADNQARPLYEIFGYKVALYEALPAFGANRDYEYVLWKKQDVPAKTPTREEAEEAIVKAWKMEKAFALAKTEAERLATEAQGKESLHAAFPKGIANAGAVQTPAPFSWLSSGVMPMGMGGQLSLTEIPEAPYAGEAFMQEVLNLAPGQVGSAPDQGHQHYYVIHVLSESPSEQVQRSMFMLRGINDPSLTRQFGSERFEQLESWLSGLQREMNVAWQRPPQSFDR